MLDLTRIERYRENNRIEAKKALGGMPHSMFETYSAFANTLGGVILLGVEEYPDHSLHPVDLPDPDGMIREIQGILNDPAKTGINLLTVRDIRIFETEGKRGIAVIVPRAERTDMPVWVDGNRGCVYRRTGEGDYRCTAEEIAQMRELAETPSWDADVLSERGTDIFDRNSIRAFRTQMRTLRPGHPSLSLRGDAFLVSIGAAVSASGAVHPTLAGALLFGNAGAVRRSFPGIRMTLKYRNGKTRACGNLFEYYRTVLACLRGPEEAVNDALAEALYNCLTHTDYASQKAGPRLSVSVGPDMYRFSNPGRLRETGRNEYPAECRNPRVRRILSLVFSRQRAGSGLQDIFDVWREHGWTAPSFRQNDAPERVILTLRTVAASGPEESAAIRNRRMRSALIEYLTDRPDSTEAEAAAGTGIALDTARKLLRRLIREKIAVQTEVDGVLRFTLVR